MAALGAARGAVLVAAHANTLQTCSDVVRLIGRWLARATTSSAEPAFAGVADLADKAGAYTEDAAIAGLVAGVLVAAAWATGLLRSVDAPPPDLPAPQADAKGKGPMQRLRDRVLKDRA